MKIKYASLLFLLCAPSAWAHTGGLDTSGFTSGFLHPLFGQDHIIAMVAVGLWGAQLGRPLLWELPVCFPAMMAIGGVLGVLGIPLPAIELMIALSGAALGLVVLLSWRAPQAAALIVVGLFAVFHGYAHGTELPEASNPLLFGIGFVVATGLLHLAGIAVGTLNHIKSGGPLAVRACGGAIMAGGVLFLIQAVG